MSDIEDIKEYKISLTQEQSVELFKNTLNKFEIRGEGLCLLKIAIKNVLSEREADKKIIKELEEEKKNRADFQQKYIEVTNLYLNSISKQKVKDKKKEIKKTGQYLYTNVDVCNILEELLEEK